MVDWWSAGIPAAVEASGPRFLATMIQLLLFGSGAFAGGLFFGRFWLTRIIQTKDAELASESRRYEAQAERLSFYGEQIEKLKEDIDSAENLQEAKEAAKDLPPPPDLAVFKIPAPRSQRLHPTLLRTGVRGYFRRLKEKYDLDDRQIADRVGVPLVEVENFMNAISIRRSNYKKLESYASNDVGGLEI